MAETLDLRLLTMRCPECQHRFGAEATFCPFDGARLTEQSWDPSGDPLIGKVIGGRYEVVGVLGEGGMGTVYKVRHTSLDRAFAMKMLRRDLASDHELAERFTREARATASVKHPNVVAISDFGEHEGVPYFVMELLGGESLARAIKTHGPIPPATAVRIALKIAAGIGAAHEQKIVHRDLKPDNVFLLGDRATGDVDVRVVDFGAAMIVGGNRVTKTGVVFGTPHYMSPEQASGQPVDHRADVYALGVILYEMFTGKLPFEGDTYMGVLTQHMFVQPVPPSQLGDGAKALGALEQVTLRALEKKPENRYATMHDLAAEIERVARFAPDGSLQVAPSVSRAPAALPSLAALQVLAQEPEAEGVTEASARRRRARAGVLYGGVVVGVAAVALLVLRLTQRGDSAPAPPPALATASATAPPLPSAIPVPVPDAPPAAPAPSSVASVPRASASRSPARPPPKKHAPAAVGDFKDPWSK